MAFTHNVVRTYQTSGGNLSNTVSQSADAEEARSLSVAVASPDTEVAISILYAGLKSIYISSSLALTVETNSSSAPDDTLSVPAGGALVWTAQDGTANPLTANVTKVFLTATGSGSSAVEIRVLQDSTP